MAPMPPMLIGKFARARQPGEHHREIQAEKEHPSVSKVARSACRPSKDSRNIIPVPVETSRIEHRRDPQTRDSDDDPK